MRGTFSQRHLLLHDDDTDSSWMGLQELGKDQAPFAAIDSPLSEESVLGFEYGYSLGDPSVLVLWEAQFGDFSNEAQPVIDQFLAGSKAKWGQPSGVVLLLPHGYEGQGPDHSSARLERFLQLAAEDNLRIANVSTPAQYFHLLRRQMCEAVRTPLIVMTPKSLLRHPRARSTVRELAEGQLPAAAARSGGAEAGCGQAARLLLGEDLLRSRGRAGKAECFDDRALSRGGTLSVPGGADPRSVGRLPRRRGGVGPGGAAQHGGVGVHG